MLKLNNQIILNAWDFQKYFSPWDAFRQLDEVIAFAQVHCKKLTVVLTEKEDPKGDTSKTSLVTLYGAKYLTKQFWIEVVEEGTVPSQWEHSSESAEACFQDIIKTKFGESNSSKLPEALLQEVTDAGINDKLQHIISEGKLTGAQDIRTAVILLALCELAGKDVFAESFRRWEEESAEHQKENTVSASQNEKLQAQDVPPSDKQKIQAEYLPEVEVLRLETRGRPYSFYYYEQEKLEEGHTIRTVRVEAVMGRDKSRNLKIQLVHPKTNQVVLSAYLNAGEFRDCNTVGGKIVKLLPTMAISKNLCVARRQGSGQFEVLPFSSDLWTIDMDPETARSVTCIAAGDEQKQGFLLVSKGHVITSFFRPCEDFFVRMEMQMITDRILEARIEPDGYCLLTSNGDVISDIPQWRGKKNVISLSDAGRYPDFKIENMDQPAEVVMNESHDSLAVRDRHSKIDAIFADDPARSIQKTGKHSIRI